MVQNDSFRRHNEDDISSSGVESINEVLGFVTEFNLNAQLFSLAAFMVTAAMTKIEAMNKIVNKHTVDINILKEEDKKLWGEVRKLSRLQIGGADSSGITRPPTGDGPIKIGSGLTLD